MNERKRRGLIVTGIVLFVIFSIVFVAISSKRIFNKFTNEDEIVSSYNTEKEKAELLQTMVTDFVDENGIKVNQIPLDKYGYKIYDENENIIFYYYLKEYSEDNPPNATITLTKEYNILEQDYSVELETFDVFKEDYINQYKIASKFEGVLNLILFYLVLALVAVVGEFLYLIFDIVYERYKENKKEQEKHKKQSIPKAEEIVQESSSDNLSEGRKMNDIGKKYRINGWRDKTYYLTAKELYERVLEDSKSNYDWIASATELVRICKEPGFPKKYANGIKIAIINCFANLEIRKEFPSHSESTAAESVSYCYHTVSEDSDDAKKVKEKYLKAIIHAITKYDRTSCRFSMHYGPAYQKVCDDWKKSKLDEYIGKKEIDFKEMREELYSDFNETIKDAEDKGVFEEDDEKHREQMRKFWKSLDI